MPDLATAKLAWGIAGQNDQIEVMGITLTEIQRRPLHRQGIDTIVDAAGIHVNAASVFAELNGDRIMASTDGVVFIDAGRNGSHQMLECPIHTNRSTAQYHRDGLHHGICLP